MIVDLAASADSWNGACGPRWTSAWARRPDTQPCAVIVGEFYNHVERCGVDTNFVELETGDELPICKEHIEAARSNS